MPDRSRSPKVSPSSSVIVPENDRSWSLNVSVESELSSLSPCFLERMYHQFLREILTYPKSTKPRKGKSRTADIPHLINLLSSKKKNRGRNKRKRKKHNYSPRECEKMKRRKKAMKEHEEARKRKEEAKKREEAKKFKGAGWISEAGELTPHSESRSQPTPP